VKAFETVELARTRLLRSAAWQFLLVASLLTGSAVYQELSAPSILLGAGLGLVALAALLVEATPPRRSLAFVYPLAVLALAAPWWLGGVHHPSTLFPVVALHVAAFQLGVRQALWIALAAIANLAALLVCQNLGLVQGSVPEPGTLVLYVSALTIHGVLFVSTPLDVVRQLLSSSDKDLAARLANENALIELTDALEANVAHRTNELILKRHMLQQSIDEIASPTGADLARLRSAARELAASLPDEHPESRSIASRIASGCERMESIHAALHRFCRLGEESLELRILPSRALTAMVHHVWHEVRSLHPDRTISFFLESLPDCLGDPDLLRQVWRNLFVRAVESTVSTANAAIHVRFEDGCFVVEDNGKGFDMPPSAGEPGELAGERIGLAISRRIVEMHGGTLRAEGAPGKGAIFRFNLRSDPPSDSSS
jgi:signal transduction histidine kinase